MASRQAGGVTRSRGSERFRDSAHGNDISFPRLKYKGPTNTPKMLTIPLNGAPLTSLDVSSEGAEMGLKNTSAHAVPSHVHEDNLEFVNGITGKSNKSIEGVQEHEIATKEATKDDASQKLLCEPKFDIVYRDGLDLGKFWMDNTIDPATPSETPKEILLRVFLPEVVKWRYVVDSMKGSAKFDKTSHKLEVSLPTRAVSTCPT